MHYLLLLNQLKEWDLASQEQVAQLNQYLYHLSYVWKCSQNSYNAIFPDIKGCFAHLTLCPKARKCHMSENEFSVKSLFITLLTGAHLAPVHVATFQISTSAILCDMYFMSKANLQCF